MPGGIGYLIGIVRVGGDGGVSRVIASPRYVVTRAEVMPPTIGARIYFATCRAQGLTRTLLRSFFPLFAFGGKRKKIQI